MDPFLNFNTQNQNKCWFAVKWVIFMKTRYSYALFLSYNVFCWLRFFILPYFIKIQLIEDKMKIFVWSNWRFTSVRYDWFDVWIICYVKCILPSFLCRMSFFFYLCGMFFLAKFVVHGDAIHFLVPLGCF